MRGGTEGLTLRKGIVEEKIFSGLYTIRDSLDGTLIQMSLTGKLAMMNFELEIGDVAYVVVGVFDRSRGRIAVEGHRGGLEKFEWEKKMLDNNNDPMNTLRGRSNLIVTTGIVVKIIDIGTFMVKLEDETIISATISRLVKLSHDIYVGEKVPIDMSPFDKTRGRINTRHWVRTKP